MSDIRDVEIQHGASMAIEYDVPEYAKQGLDDDGKPKRTGNAWTASAHIVTAMIGSGILSLAWGFAQLGWIWGLATLLIFSAITLMTSNMLANCYRTPDPITGKRNYTYMEEVQATLGKMSCNACGLMQYSCLTGLLIGYTITASISMVAVHKSDCFHSKGHDAPCMFSCNPYMIGMGIFEIFLSQVPNFHKLTMISTVATVMSFVYSSVGIGLALEKIISGKGGVTTVTGVEVGIDVNATEKVWRTFNALGDIAFTYGFSLILVEVQDTLKSSPAENKEMKKANAIAMFVTTTFYIVCGCTGYAAFGNSAPGNMLTGFGFYEPYWLVNLGNICIAIHILGAYQVIAQPVFKRYETWAVKMWPDSRFIKGEYPITVGNKNVFSFNLLRLTGRTIMVILVTTIAMAMPFFNSINAMLGSIVFWPLSIYFPIEMYIVQTKIKRWSRKWTLLQLLSAVCFLVSLAAACGSIQGIGAALHGTRVFQFKV